MGADDPLAKLRHDLNNPLTAVLAEAQLLLVSDVPLTDEVRSAVQQIETQALRMVQMLKATRAETGAPRTDGR